MTEAQEREFARGCLERGLCPRCLNGGASDAQNLDAFGDCASCGLRLHDLVHAQGEGLPRQ